MSEQRDPAEVAEEAARLLRELLEDIDEYAGEAYHLEGAGADAMKGMFTKEDFILYQDALESSQLKSVVEAIDEKRFNRLMWAARRRHRASLEVLRELLQEALSPEETARALFPLGARVTVAASHVAELVGLKGDVTGHDMTGYVQVLLDRFSTHLGFLPNELQWVEGERSA